MTKRRVDTKGFLAIRRYRETHQHRFIATSMTQAMHQLHTCYHIYCWAIRTSFLYHRQGYTHGGASL